MVKRKIVWHGSSGLIWSIYWPWLALAIFRIDKGRKNSLRSVRLLFIILDMDWIWWIFHMGCTYLGNNGLQGWKNSFLEFCSVLCSNFKFYWSRRLKVTVTINLRNVRYKVTKCDEQNRTNLQNLFCVLSCLVYRRPSTGLQSKFKSQSKSKS